MSTEFVPALELNAEFYREAVAPLVASWPHAAAHLGFGSDVLGFDTERSTDHGWGPRVFVFVEADAVDAATRAVETGLPETFRGRPVRFGWDEVRPTHHVHVLPLDVWLSHWLGCNPLAGMSTVDWLATPQQLLLGVARGAVYNDDLGVLTTVREQLAYFPAEVRLWMLACQWRRVEQEEHFVGRIAEVGDDVGSRIVAARQVRELMRLHFLIASEYWPYSKWLGTAYRMLAGSDQLEPLFAAALAAPDFPTREAALVPAYEALARMHNETGLTEPVDPTVRPFHNRPFLTIASDRFVTACRAALRDEFLTALPMIGSIDQCVDSTDVTQYPPVARRLRALYSPTEPA